MTVAKQRRARPAIKPIKTSASALRSFPQCVLTPAATCNVCGVSPLTSRGSLGHLSPLPTSSFGSATPAYCITPNTFESAAFAEPTLLLPVGFGRAILDGHGAVSPGGVPSPTWSPRCHGCGTASHCRQPMSALSASERNVARFQTYRRYLWCEGQKHFGKAQNNPFFVVPISSIPEQKGPANGGEDSKSHDTAQSPTGDESVVSFSAIVVSKDGKAIKLKRDFALRKLHETIPEPLPSPQSPNFDRSSLLAPFSPAPSPLSPEKTTSYTGPTTRLANSRRRKQPAHGASSPLDEKLQRAQVPMHLSYVRAQLPVLASIMLSGYVTSESKIFLPMPHPKKWAETAAFVYTGQEEFLSAEVRENIVHLGGRVQDEAQSPVKMELEA